MEGPIVSRLCRAVRRCCWTKTTRRRRRYQQLPPATSSKRPVAWRGIRLGRRRLALGSTTTAWRSLDRPRRRRAERWSPRPLHMLITRAVDTCINSVFLRPLKAVKGFSPARVGSEEDGASSPPPKLPPRADSSRPTSRRGKEFGCGKGVMLNICVAEVLLSRSSSQVRTSPLRVARKDGRGN
ncbi:hypothetical protein QOZ80_1BG0074280 [Eleusine coracana subsp. coracana]|nr:hypothetical protein QOZ80_1BG0074280 [Eleusine coracana subsp. coracana]